MTMMMMMTTNTTTTTAIIRTSEALFSAQNASNVVWRPAEPGAAGDLKHFLDPYPWPRGEGGKRGEEGKKSCTTLEVFKSRRLWTRDKVVSTPDRDRSCRTVITLELIDMPVYSFRCWIGVFSGRPGGRFSSAVGGTCQRRDWSVG